MISATRDKNLVSIAVLGEFTLADFQEFEKHVLSAAAGQSPVNVLVDLRDMVNYTVDVMLEELKFTYAHEREFGKIAVVTEDQWVTWSAWLQRLFVDTDLEVFSDFDAAKSWVQAS